MAKTFEKRALLTGVGALFVDFLENEPNRDEAPEYAGAVVETPSIETASMALELDENLVYLSNLLHDDLSNVVSATITLDAGYLPQDFEDEAQGKVKIGGSWAMPTNPSKKPFRMAVPFTDNDGKELILNFPHCTLSPVDLSATTQGETTDVQMKSFNIVAQPLNYGEQPFVFLSIDMANEENEAQYDRDKLLENGWYDEASLALNEGIDGA